MNRTSWLILAVSALLLGVITLYFYLSNPFTSATPTSSSTTSEPKTPDNWKEVTRGQINVRTPFTEVGQYSGKILIIGWGCAKIDARHSCYTPKGHATLTGDETFVINNASLYMLVVKIGEKYMPVGESNTFDIATPSKISLGSNEATGGNGYTDNVGTWDYKICVPK